MKHPTPGKGPHTSLTPALPAAAPAVTALNVPSVEREEFAKNFLDVAVLELRFPTLLQLSRADLTPFHAAIRKEYPKLTEATDIAVLPLPAQTGVPPDREFRFSSRDEDWSIAWRHDVVRLETKQYRSFDAFRTRAEFMIRSALPLLDTDFFTRVGLRYINTIPISDDNLPNWINESLVQPLAAGIYGTVHKYVHEVRGFTEGGTYTFRHGFAETRAREQPRYLLDFDFAANDVQVGDLMPTVERFHDRCYDFFMWCIGPGTKSSLRGEEA